MSTLCMGVSGACPGIRKGRGPKSESLFFFFFCFSIFQGGGPAQKIAEKMIFSTTKVAKYRWNSLKFALMTFFFFFFFAFQFLGGGPGPPLDTRLCILVHWNHVDMYTIIRLVVIVRWDWGIIFYHFQVL